MAKGTAVGRDASKRALPRAEVYGQRLAGCNGYAIDVSLTLSGLFVVQQNEKVCHPRQDSFCSKSVFNGRRHYCMHVPRVNKVIFRLGATLIVCIALAINAYGLARLSLNRGAEKPARLLFLLAAGLGDGRAQNNVASMYAEGRGGVRNDELAVYWYQRAADAGITQAMFNLGNFYEEGRGVVRSTPKAAELFRKAAEKGDLLASFNLGLLYASPRADFTQDYAAATNWYLRAANAGFASAQFNLGNLYLMGLNGPKDFERAREWYEKAAAQGHAKAILDLGAIHAFGLSRQSDFERGMKLLQRAVQSAETSATAKEYIGEVCAFLRLEGTGHQACAKG